MEKVEKEEKKENYLMVQSFLNAYVNSSFDSRCSFHPEFIYNNKECNPPKKVFDTLIENLENCKSFLFSVAFINDSGLSLLKQVLKEISLKSPQVKGRIITSNYLGFTEPKALEELSQFENIEVRMFYIDQNNPIGFHTKGYIFEYEEENYKAIIGSSNLTQSALTCNNEWNNLLISKREGKIMNSILNEYERMWKKSLPLKQVLEVYKKEYQNWKKKREEIKATDEKDLKPNTMQECFITNWHQSILKGQKKGLLISATGTGKTYASAFGVASITEFPIHRLLFVTHRETILKQAMNTYQKVFKNKYKMALFTGNNHKTMDADFLFSTINTISDNKYLSSFQKDEFDIVIIDECHRIGEKTRYQNILSYFTPRYLLGMSATPDRNDNYDIYQVFDHNILFEIRLENALDCNILVPFHYFGISDLTIDGKSITEEASISELTSKERVKKILEASHYYGFSGERLKALVFVSRVEEGKKLAEEINEMGVKCQFLSGDTNPDIREKAIEELQEDDLSKPYLEMIITRDIFNEGVDIPSINQVIFLRPTTSSIIFIQQLGRGLRLYPEKEYLTVIDFIGNYRSNFLIPESFSQKGSGQKRGETSIHPITPGASVVQFDEISKKRIIQSISQVANTEKRRIKDQFYLIKNKLGRIPTLMEFDQGGILSGRSFLDFFQNGYSSYYEFLFAIGEEKCRLSQDEQDTLKYISRNIGPGLRIQEALLLKTLMQGETYQDFCNQLEKDDQENHVVHLLDKDVLNSMESILSTFFDTKKNQSYHWFPLCQREKDKFVLTDEFKNALNHVPFKKYIDQILNYAIYSYHQYFKGYQDEKNNFVLYEKYTRKDVCHLINNLKNEEGTINGYKIFKELNIVPIFVTYHKNLKEDDPTNYQDAFQGESIFLWDSRSNRTLESKEIKELLSVLKNPKGKVMLFIKRDDVVDQNGNAIGNNRDTSFYYLGEVNLLAEPKEAINGKDVKTKVVRFAFGLKEPVRKDIYDYLISKPIVE